MSISSATIRSAAYWPEILASADLPTIAASSVAAPPLLWLTRLGSYGLICKLMQIGLAPAAGLFLNIMADGKINLQQLPSISMIPWGVPNNFIVPAIDNLYYNFFNATLAPITNQQSYYSLQVIKPSIAEKLKWGIPLSSTEQALVQKYNIQNLVKDGNLPLQWPYMLEREYQQTEEDAYTSISAVPTSGATILDISPRQGEFLVLVGIAADTGVVANNTTIHISRDVTSGSGGIEDYMVLNAASMPGYNNDINLFMPALKEILITCQTSVAIPGATYKIRATVIACKLTETLKYKWGLDNSLPQVTQERVDCGLY